MQIKINSTARDRRTRLTLFAIYRADLRTVRVREINPRIEFFFPATAWTLDAIT